METKGNYGVKVEIRPECLCSHPSWKEPTTEEIRAVLKMANWTAEEFSRRIGVTGRTVRRWTLGEKPISYSPWCVLCAQAGFGQIWLDNLLTQA